MSKEDTRYLCTSCGMSNKRRDLGPEAKWGIFMCPNCQAEDCGQKECCDPVFEQADK